MIKQFILGSKQYKVEHLEKLEEGGLARCISPVSLIKIAKTFQGINVPGDAQEQNFYHELVHAILDEIGREDLSNDETFVQSFALLLHQFENTKKK